MDFRSLPGVDRVLAELEGPHVLAVAAARAAIAAAREDLRAGRETPDHAAIVADARERLSGMTRAKLTPVINATGVMLHTNLGRAPLGDEQLRAVLDIAGGYSDLEYSRESGRRGSRYVHASPLINALVGSESSLVVNNNAAAVLLMLAALCKGREVIISRGELVEIGGEFRIPEVMEHAGVELVEVGTTNRTHIADYEKAIGPRTAAIMKVHPSNYQVVGFTAEVSAHDLARLAHGRRVFFFNDLGSGLIESPPHMNMSGEPLAAEALAEGADLVTFSGDKLLGGPQAGVIAGRAELIEKITGNALLRTMRVDKMTLAALEATLLMYLEGRQDEIPLWSMANASNEELEARARAVVAAIRQELPDAKLDAIPTQSVTGGGSAPGDSIDSWGVAVDPGDMGAERIATELRGGTPVIVGRIEDGLVILDLRTVPASRDTSLIEALANVLR